MNTPPSSSPPPSGEQEPPKTGDNLKHFSRMINEPTREQLAKENIASTISSAVIDFGQNVKNKIVNVFSFFSAKRKNIIIAVAVFIVVSVAGVVIPNIPLQIKRGAAFKAFSAGDYKAAYHDFQEYIKKRPKDREAVYYSVRAARLIGEYQYAAAKIREVSQYAEYSSSPDFLYEWSLVLVAESLPKAMVKLDELITQSPNHVAGRLLRGIILGANVDIRRSRDDFIKADEIMRSQAGDDNEVESSLLQLRDYLLDRGLFPTDQEFLSPSFNADTYAWGQDFGASPTAEGFINSYSTDERQGVFADEKPSAVDIIALYYVKSLLDNGEIDNARAALREVAGAGISLLAENMRAFLLLNEKKYTAAAEVFKTLSEKSPNLAPLLVNLANSQWLANPSIDAVREVLAIYEKALAVDAHNIVALNNRAVMHIILGRYVDAKAGLSRIVAGTNPKSDFNMALLAVQIGNANNALTLLESLLASNSNFKSLRHVKARVMARLGDYGGAITLLDKIALETLGNNQAIVLLRVRYLIEQRLWMRARRTLLNLLDSHPQPDLKWRYYMALVALFLGDAETEEEQSIALAEADGGNHYAAAIRAEKLARGKNAQGAAAALKTALQEAPLWTDRAEYIYRHGYALAGLDQELALETVQMYFFEDIRLATRPAVIALFARLQAEKNAKVTEILLKNFPQPIILPSILHNVGLAKIALGNPQGALQNLSVAAQFLPVNFAILKDIKSVYEILEDNESSTQLQSVLEYLKGLSRGESVENRVVYEVVFTADSALKSKIIKAIKDPGQVQSALIAYRDAIDKSEDAKEQSELLYARATFFIYLRRYDEAIADLDVALKARVFNKEKESLIRLFYGNLLFLQERYGESVRQFKKILEEKDVSPLPRRLYANVLYKKGDIQSIKAAEREIKIVLKKFPADLDSYILLSDIEYDLKDSQTAIETLRKAARVLPSYSIIYDKLYERQKILSGPLSIENREIFEDIRGGLQSQLN